jgi:hypothetical protein
MERTDEQFELEGEGGAGGGGGEDENLTDEEKAERARAQELETGRAAVETLGKFRPFIDALENDPSKVFDFRAVLEGKKPGDPAPVVTRDVAPQLTAEQLEDLNAKLQAEWVNNPAAVMAWLKNNAKNEALEEFRTAAAPVIDAVGGGFVDAFKRLKKENDRFYPLVLAKFEDEIDDLKPGVLLNMTPAQRNRELDRRWNAAKGEVLDKKIKPQTTHATSAGNGTSMGPSGGGKRGEKVVELSETEKGILVRTLGPDLAKKRIAAIESGAP